MSFIVRQYIYYMAYTIQMLTKSEYTTIKVSRDHRNELAKLATFDDSFDTLIGKLLKEKQLKGVDA